MSNYKLAFTLKQHTPLIHFKGDQSGATLRATELKSYVDNFIKNDLNRIDIDLYQEYKTFIEDKNIFPDNLGSNAYSIRIIQKGRKTFKNNDETKKIGSYFGDNPSVIYDDDLIVRIFSKKQKLAEFIDKVLVYVVTYHGFGTRSNKGFGSYFMKNISQSTMESILLKKYTSIFKFESNQPLADIKNKYMLMKGGINYRDRQNNKKYEKSKLFNFFCERDIRWEKRQIKEIISNNFPDIFNAFTYDRNDASSNRILHCNNESSLLNFKFIRALLGLAELFEYQATNNVSYIVFVRDTEGEINRFKSPITFKVYENTVYLLPETIPDIMFNRNFTFDLKKKVGQQQAVLVKNGESFMNIYTPLKVEGENLIESFLRAQNFQELRS